MQKVKDLLGTNLESPFAGLQLSGKVPGYISCFGFLLGCKEKKSVQTSVTFEVMKGSISHYITILSNSGGPDVNVLIFANADIDADIYLQYLRLWM